MTTVAENIQQKAETSDRWKEANPGFSWSSEEHPEEEEKIYITKDLLNSMAYRSLSRCAFLVYQDFLGKRVMDKKRKKVWITKNNGEIIYPYLEAEEKGFTRKQFRDAIDELQQMIDIKHLGKGGRKPAEGTGDVSMYWIDDRWKLYGTDDFKPARNPRNKDTRKSRGWALLNDNPIKKKAVLLKRKEALRKKLGVEKNTS